MAIFHFRAAVIVIYEKCYINYKLFLTPNRQIQHLQKALRKSEWVSHKYNTTVGESNLSSF